MLSAGRAIEGRKKGVLFILGRQKKKKKKKKKKKSSSPGRGTAGVWGEERSFLSRAGAKEHSQSRSDHDAVGGAFAKPGGTGGRVSTSGGEKEARGGGVGGPKKGGLTEKNVLYTLITYCENGFGRGGKSRKERAGLVRLV